MKRKLSKASARILDELENAVHDEAMGDSYNTSRGQDEACALQLGKARASATKRMLQLETTIAKVKEQLSRLQRLTCRPLFLTNDVLQ